MSGKKIGSKRFLFRYTYQGRKCSITIGRFPNIDVLAARKLCGKEEANVKQMGSNLDFTH
ncbi:Arm DNA-binding domain-containing protein [Pseudoalteromonas arctica]|uniref:Arm DNA-binding domain-containing protein n=1 Tax=Pseudoalteromonas arctica TaxID=394751 RepID=UPI00307B103C